VADTSGTIDQQPVLLRFTAALDAALDRLGDPDPAFLSTSERRRALLELAREEERITALRVRVQGAADDVAEDVGARDAGVVLASWTRRDRRRVAAEQRLADALQRRWAATGVAWREGRLNGEQAAVIAAALDRLPATVAPELLGRAEEHLVDQGAHHDPHGLRVLGSRIWEVIAPDEAEEQLRRALEAQERNARAATKLNLHGWATGRPGSEAASRTAWPPGLRHCWSPSPAPVGTTSPVPFGTLGPVSGCPRSGCAGRHSAPSSSTPTPIGCPGTARRRPACWSPSTWTGCAPTSAPGHCWTGRRCPRRGAPARLQQ
jgi:hypothetical protein